MFTKKLISLILALVMVVSCFTVSFVTANAETNYNEYEKMLEAIKPENNYGLAKTVNEGKIIQAWNWSFNNVIKNLEKLAEQGFTTIQVSPPNELKMPTKGVKVCEPAVGGIAPNGWWMFYQPAGFQLNESEDNALGTKAEFVKMCEEAHKLGLKVIVDAVINHMGTDDDHIGVYNNPSTDPMDHVNPRAAQFEPELLDAKAFHSPWVDMTYKENYWDGFSDYDIEEDLTQHCTSGLPDLDTSTQLVQDTIYDYFVELVEAGADGFRFDAAKHIETKYDTYFASDFWDDTLIKLRENYPDKECYAYGEILNKCGDGRPFYEYTWMMDVTDSSSYWGIKEAVVNMGNGGNPTPFYQSEAEGCDPTSVNFTKENVIQWNESHDTYIDGGTSSLTVQQRNKIWALSAARQKITGVYFARPDDRTGANRAAIETICANITLGDAALTSWTAPEVKAVNQFDNYFGDASEWNSTVDKVTMIERGGLGATLVNLGGTTKSVNMKVNTLAEGNYIDSITGNTFTVTNGKLTGSIGSTGIACIYYAQDTEPVLPEPSQGSIWDVPVDWASGTFPEFEGYTTIVLSSKTWSEAYSYCWVKGTDNYDVAWPGTPMKKVTDDNGYGEKQFVAYIPDEYDMYIINNGNGGGSNQTIDLSVPNSSGVWLDTQAADGKWNVGYWSPNFVPTPIPGTVKPTEPVPTEPIPTEPIPTEPIPTEPIPTEPVGPEGLFVRADDVLYEVEQGETYTFTYYLNVPNAKIGSFNATTYFDAEGLEVCPVVDEFGDPDTTAMFPIFKGATVYNMNLDGRIRFNYSSTNPVRFPNEDSVAMTVGFKVTAESGIYDIDTVITTMADTDLYRYVFECEVIDDSFAARDVLDAPVYVDPNKPTEPTQPEPTQPEPTEPGDDFLYGDVDGNGKVNIFDASFVQKSIAGYDGYDLDERAFKAADVDFNGKINVFDASRIQKFIAGYFDSFK